MRLYRILKKVANLVIVVGLLVMLFAIGRSLRQAYISFSTLVHTTGRVDSILSAFSPQPLSAIQAASMPTRPPTKPEVDMEAWEDFDPSVFDEETEGFLPVQVLHNGAQAPPLTSLNEGLSPSEGPSLSEGAAGTAADIQQEPPTVMKVYLPQVASPGIVVEPDIVVLDYGTVLPGTEAPTPEPVPIRAPERIVIPRIGLDAPIVMVSPTSVNYAGQVYDQWLAPPEYAAGWHQNTARLGEVGNTVLNGHHNILGMVFARLLELQQNDEVIVYGEGEAYHYIINQVMILEERGSSVEQRAENARWIMPSGDERLTLVTCWPPESNTHRLIVVATRQ